jgi:MATE family multidrug resistance protein
VVNAVANYALVYGHLGAPRMGIVGSAWATNLARLFMAVLVLAWSARQGLRFAPGFHSATMRELLRLGIPASVQLFFEGGVFSLSTVLMARFGASAAAAHQVVMQIASFTFMVPLGVSIAGAVRVGNALGRDDPDAARRAGSSAVTLAAVFMVFSGVALLLGATAISQGFHLDPESAGLARRFLVCAAFFQLFDGMQISLSGVLRGTGDTVASMVANLVGHWGVGLPVGCLLAFSFGLRGVGLWLGLAAGLFAVAMTLLVVWRRRIRELAEREAG